MEIHVKNDAELRAAILDSVELNTHIDIFFERNIGLVGETLTIPSGANVTLTSDSILTNSMGVDFFSLYGAAGLSTIVVNDSGVLTLDGIIVTHVAGATGRGVTVNSGGILYLYSGKISDNLYTGGSGGGVWINDLGRFMMSGGTISNNTARFTAISSGGGVYATGDSSSFVLTGGVISGNSASTGGGVFIDAGSFVMSDGTISNNIARNDLWSGTGRGGGVWISGSGRFVMSDGAISNNIATVSDGGGVIIASSSFVMSNGTISNNIAGNTGGGVCLFGSSSFPSHFAMSDGAISNNTALNGGGVHTGDFSSFVLSGGVISDNSASSPNTAGNGGGVFIYGTNSRFVMADGAISNNVAYSSRSGYGNGGGAYVYGVGSSFIMFGGKISDNTASNNGGGVWITDNNTNFDKFMIPAYAFEIIFSGNRASAACNIAPIHHPEYNAYIQREAVWTEPFTQGYNNYDISYISTGETQLTYSVSVIDSNAQITGAGTYVAGFNVCIDAGIAPEGEEFKTWETNSDNVFFANPLSKVTTFYMPNNDVTIKAIFEPKVTSDVEYVVHYYLQGTTTSVIPTRIVIGHAIGADVTESAISVPDYTALAPTKVTTTLNATNNEIIFYYTPNTNTQYTVHYYLAGTNYSVVADKIVTGQVMNTTVTENAVHVAGYTADAASKTLILVATDNEITFYYRANSDIEYTEYTEYTVHYYLIGTTTALVSDKIVTGQNMSTTITENAVAIAGYTVDFASKSLLLGASGNEIIFYYTQPHVGYVVHYYLVGTSTSVAPDKIIPIYSMGTFVTERAVVVAGYTVDAETKSLLLGASGNEIVFYYFPVPDIYYTVHYYVAGTTVLLAPDKVVTGQAMGSTVTENAVPVAGYTVDVPTQSLTLGASGNEIIFYYFPVPDIYYTVHYYVAGTTVLLAPDKVVTGQAMGSTVTETAITIAGYTVLVPDSLTATLYVTDNVFTFYYEVIGNGTGVYVVHYYLEGTTIPLVADKYVFGQTIASVVTENALSIAGYSVDFASKSLLLDASSNEIVFYYACYPIEYVVHYYLEGTTIPLAPSKTVTDQTMNTTVIENALTIPGYTVFSTYESLTLAVTGNVITFYYIPMADVSYVVHYYLLDTTTSVIADKIVTGQSLGSIVTEHAITVPSHVIWNTISLTAALNATDNVFTFYYEDSPGVVACTVHYYLFGTTFSLVADKFITGYYTGSIITENAVTIEGYTVDAASKTLILTATSNGVVFYYTPVDNIVHVQSEVELVQTVNAAVAGTPLVIALDNDITLTKTLTILGGKQITLTSNKNANKFYKLIGTNNEITITVENGALTLDGIIITHAAGAEGRGVSIYSTGTLIMLSGAISDNTVSWAGGGVYNNGGIFQMLGGAIVNNTAGEYGGGVYNNDGSTFTMSGGTILGNTAKNGGGIFNRASVTLFGDAEISYNVAGYGGGGISSASMGTLTMMDNSAILGNSAFIGGGIFVSGDFEMLGGTIANNIATEYGGGVYVNDGSIFAMLDGKIVGNTAKNGGGIYNRAVTTIAGNSEISYNVAGYGGGGISSASMGTLTMTDNSLVRNNTAVVGGGAFVSGIFEWHNGLVYGNNAGTGADMYVLPNTGRILYPVTVNGNYATITDAVNYAAGITVIVNADITPDEYQLKN